MTNEERRTILYYLIAIVIILVTLYFAYPSYKEAMNPKETVKEDPCFVVYDEEMNDYFAVCDDWKNLKTENPTQHYVLDIAVGLREKRLENRYRWNTYCDEANELTLGEINAVFEQDQRGELENKLKPNEIRYLIDLSNFLEECR